MFRIRRLIIRYNNSLSFEQKIRPQAHKHRVVKEQGPASEPRAATAEAAGSQPPRGERARASASEVQEIKRSLVLKVKCSDCLGYVAL